MHALTFHKIPSPKECTNENLCSIILYRIISNIPAFSWLRKRHHHMLRDVMKETWAFQKAELEGHEEELPQRFQMAFMQGVHQAHTEILQELRQTVVKIVRLRFPNLVRLTKKQISSTADSAILRDLIVKMSIAQTSEEAVIYLLEVDEDEEDED